MLHGFRSSNFGALALVVTLSPLGIPLPAHAADRGSPPLTFNGRPLSQLLKRTAFNRPFPPTRFLEQETGQISGVALNGDGAPLAAHPVQLKRIRILEKGLQGEQVVGTVTTNPNGGFTFTGLAAGEYLMEVIVADAVASVSATLVAGAMQVSSVAVSPVEWPGADGEISGRDSEGMGPRGWAGAGIAAGLLIFTLVAFSATG